MAQLCTYHDWNVPEYTITILYPKKKYSCVLIRYNLWKLKIIEIHAQPTGIFYNFIQYKFILYKYHQNAFIKNILIHNA